MKTWLANWGKLLQTNSTVTIKKYKYLHKTQSAEKHLVQISFESSVGGTTKKSPSSFTRRPTQRAKKKMFVELGKKKLRYVLIIACDTINHRLHKLRAEPAACLHVSLRAFFFWDALGGSATGSGFSAHRSTGRDDDVMRHKRRTSAFSLLAEHRKTRDSLWGAKDVMELGCFLAVGARSSSGAALMG